MIKTVGVRKKEKLSYLHTFSVDYITRSGKHKEWEAVSRSGLERFQGEIESGESHSDGTMIFATDRSHEKVVILREFRVIANRFVYALPAGLTDDGENILDVAKREFFEETGLDLEPIMADKERFTSVGLSNEKVNVVYGYFDGTPSDEHQEDSEYAEILIIDRDEAKRILKEEEVSFRTAVLLEYFFKLNDFFERR